MLTLGFSPCPNDTFIFDAMIHGKIDTEGLDFQVEMADVEVLNKKAMKGTIDITKLSYHAYAYLTHQYQLLHSGSALGNNCGPLLIAKKTFAYEEISALKIAIPGKYTTANFLLSYAFPKLNNRIEMLFSDIENAVLAENVDAGLIIHENRFTYMEKGLLKLIDLGEYWETNTGLPIPLGGIVVHRNIPTDIQQKINRVLRRSVAFALQNPEQTLPYVRQYAQEMDDKVMMQHINLYVNDYTVNLGEKGKKAIRHMYQKAAELEIATITNEDIFIFD